MMSCLELARRLEKAALRAKNEIEVPTEAVVLAVSVQAKAVLGTYAYGWPRLKPTTIARKKNGDTPLLETGDLRNSIQHAAALTGRGAEGLVYSTDQVAIYQELGTSRGIPPRPFLMASMIRCEPVVKIAFAQFVGRIFQ